MFTQDRKGLRKASEDEGVVEGAGVCVRRG